MYEWITCAIQLYGAHLGPPLISAAPLTLFSSHDQSLMMTNFMFIEPLLAMGLNLKKKLWLRHHQTSKLLN